MSITEVAVKRPLLITVIFTVLILFGVISYKELNYNLLPKFEANVVTIMTTYRGASPDEVENSVTKKIEESVSAVEGLDKLTSSSMEGASVVIIQLKAGVDVTKTQQDVQRKVDGILSQLPDEITRPVVNKFSTDEMPVMRLGVNGNLSPTLLYDLMDKKIKPQLANVSGVGQVTVVGGNPREIKVNIDQNKIQAYKLSITQVSQAIIAANKSFPSGKVETERDQFSIKFDAKIGDVDILRNLIVKQNADGSKICLKDIAEVVDTQSDATAINHVNGIPSLGIMILKQTDANAVEVCNLVKQKIEVLEKQYASNELKFDISVDQSKFTLASADAVIHDLYLAVFIVAVVMLLFLHSVRSSMFVLVALPSSMIPTFIAMYLLGFSLNLMTLMALSLVVGILVDDSIVVLENIYRHMEMGKDKRTASLDGRSEIGFTALAITLVDVVVFVPLAMTSGLIGNILREFSLVVVFSTLMSLMVSFTITPLLVSRFGKLEVLSPNSLWGKINIGFENFLDAIKNEYGKLLRWSLSSKRWVLLATIILLIGSFALLPLGFIGATFISSGDRGEMSVKLELASQSSLYQTNMMAQKVEKMIMAKPEVVKVVTTIGYSSSSPASGGGSNSNIAEMTVVMVDKEARNISAEDFGVQLKGEIAKIPGVKVTVNPVNITGSSGESPIQVAVKGTDMKVIREAAAMVKDAVKSVPGTQYVQYSAKDPKPEIEVTLDREKMAQLGLSASDVGMTLQNAFRGDETSKFKVGGNEYDIFISLDKFDRSNIADVKNLTFVNNKGQNFQLDQFSEVKETMGESVLERIDRLSSIKINSSVVGRPVGTVGTEIKAKVDNLKLPDGVMIEYLGDMQRQKDAFGSLGLALILALVLVYLIMVALYESVVYPFVVLFAIPVATVGAFLALALTMESLSIFSIVGMIMLIGLVTKNAILIVDFANQLKEEGHSVKEALIEAGKERLRPILMTTIAMIVGMLPIALSKASGAEVKNGMAWVIIGGLTSSLLLTLVVVPAVYMIVETIINKFKPKKKDEAQTGTEEKVTINLPVMQN
ncbi:efflux RND transporter permease subunit [Sporocytophaga myxococcoides]|uniref:efflux RND transporter permease subunit n=1 Tax=Sporocytophaga myxococcoides TaxID=153721 RepID=UPI0004016BC3|nr:efflux RND transporter permease subunit [Sporocytophaga myxococcoides]